MAILKRLPIHLQACASLLLPMMLCMGHANVSAQSVRIDTVFAEGCPMLWEGDPEEFYLADLPDDAGFILRSAMYRGVMLDSEFKLRSMDPMCSYARSGAAEYDYAGYAFCDSLVMIMERRMWRIARPGHASDAIGCAPLTLDLTNLKPGRSDQGVLQPRLDFQFVVEPQGADRYRLYLGMEIREALGKPLKMASLPPFLQFELAQHHGKWRLHDVPWEGKLLPVPSATHLSPIYYGRTTVRANRQGIWRADNITPWVQCYDQKCQAIDSVYLHSPSVRSDSFYVYDITKSPHANFEQLSTRYNQYSNFLASDDYLVRSVYLGGQQGCEWIVHQIKTHQTRIVKLEANRGLLSLHHNRAFMIGTRQGNEVAIPYIDLAQFFE